MRLAQTFPVRQKIPPKTCRCFESRTFFDSIRWLGFFLVTKFTVNDLTGLLALLLLSCSGCAAEWCHLPDDCAYAFSQCQLGREIRDVCCGCQENGCASCGSGVACGVRVYEDAVWIDEPPALAPPARRPRIKVGPPPVSYQPPMPPKFLPVPARPVFVGANTHFPVSVPGQVEVGYGPQLAFPAGQ